MNKNATNAPDPAALAAGPVTNDLVKQLLHDVIDPELGVNIVDLGLVYDVAADRTGVLIRMTLTTPGCPLGGYLDDEVGRCLAQLPGRPPVAVDLVWDPPWRPEMMTDAAKSALGWFR